MISKVWTVTLLEGFNDIKFGTPRDDVRRQIEAKYKEYKKNKFSKNTLDDYGDFHLYYDESNALEAVEVFSNIEITVNKKMIFPGMINNALEAIPDLKEEAGGYISISNSVGIEAPEGNIESILFAKRNYYNF